MRPHVGARSVQVSLTNFILEALGTAAHLAEDLMYVVLFLVFMLMHNGHEPPPPGQRGSEDPSQPVVDHFARKVDRQIFVYIRGKVRMHTTTIACAECAVCARARACVRPPAFVHGAPHKHARAHGHAP